jgi:hypothetical protein
MPARRTPLVSSASALALALLGASACDGPTPTLDAGMDAPLPTDAGSDAREARDAVSTPDAARTDAGSDAGSPDVGIDTWAGCVGPPGLYAEGSCTVLADGVRAFHPAHALFSDGLDKERFVYLPPGTQIDTSDPDRWAFPVGTRLYKTFSMGGQRIETRLLEKIDAPRGTSSWRMVSYLWSEDQQSVSLVSAFGERDVHGTEHDIPSLAECIRCHSVAQDDAADGFSAIQLAHDEGGVTLATLVAEGWLTDPIDPADAVIPGDAATVEALGYLHANCGNCHGGPAPEHGLDHWIRVGTADVASTGTWRTSICSCSVWTRTLPSGETANLRIAPGHPDTSVAVLRMSSRSATEQMPPIGSRLPDDEGVRLVSEWIASLDETANGCPHGCPWP